MTTGLLTQLIDKTLIQEDKEPRSYIGASSVGHSCDRNLWYAFNGFQPNPLSQKQWRTFAIGKKLESLIVDCLINAGLNIVTQWGELHDADIFLFQGHLDAVWVSDLGEPTAIIEIKTARDSSYNIFYKKGLREWNYVYYSQLQAYMGMSGIHEAYLIALNKDTSEIHDEHVFFDARCYEDLKQKASRIITAETIPARINNDRYFFMCRSCSFNKECHQ